MGYFPVTEHNFSRHMVLLRKRKNGFSKLLFHHPPRETCWESQTLIVGGDWLWDEKTCWLLHRSVLCQKIQSLYSVWFGIRTRRSRDKCLDQAPLQLGNVGQFPLVAYMLLITYICIYTFISWICSPGFFDSCVLITECAKGSSISVVSSKHLYMMSLFPWNATG